MAELNLQPNAGAYTCLDVTHQKAVEVCFEEIDDCHTQLASAENVESKTLLPTILISLAGGFVLGTMLAVKLK